MGNVRVYHKLNVRVLHLKMSVYYTDINYYI